MILVADFTVFQGFGGDERGIMVQLVSYHVKLLMHISTTVHREIFAAKIFRRKFNARNLNALCQLLLLSRQVAKLNAQKFNTLRINAVKISRCTVA